MTPGAHPERRGDVGLRILALGTQGDIVLIDGRYDGSSYVPYLRRVQC
jgi:hypothetical protein